jgi:hypothetical protein
MHPYTHKQGTLSDTWQITHLLNKKPSIIVIDKKGREVVPTVIHNSNTRCTVQFSKPYAGEAYCS